MHIPDGFLSVRVAVATACTALVGLGSACAALRVARSTNRALLGVSAAFVFAAQLVNFPIVAGTSGHLIGATLCVALLGLPSAIVVMSAVLIVQCLVFGDGGLLALGANITNMALVSSLVSDAIYRLACGRAPSPTRRVASVAFAAWCAIVVSSAVCAGELALSGAARAGVVVPAMVLVHAVIGVAEAAITALVVASVARFRLELLEHDAATIPGNLLRAAFALALAVALALAPFASASPDGLERVAAQLGLHARSWFAAPLSNYALPGLPLGAFSVALSGVLGTLCMFGSCWLLARALVREPRAAESPEASAVAEPSG
ncbi:MAG TPA: energy-coupling factor ABC transporter permease [Polyangiaceae bacterium]|jgi:cobalt/nickel transport system permease protein